MIKRHTVIMTKEFQLEIRILIWTYMGIGFKNWDKDRNKDWKWGEIDIGIVSE